MSNSSPFKRTMSMKAIHNLMNGIAQKRFSPFAEFLIADSIRRELNTIRIRKLKREALKLSTTLQKQVAMVALMAFIVFSGLTGCAAIKRHPVATSVVTTGAFAAGIAGTVMASHSQSSQPVSCCRRVLRDR